MVTTIQVQDNTLLLLRKLRDSLQASSYDEAIVRVAREKMAPKKSMAGSLGKYLKKYSTEQMIKDLREERRKDDE